MKILKYIVLFFTLVCVNTLFSQQDSIKSKNKLQVKLNKFDPLKPSKAAFYSAILPGAGQVYNNRYWWQIPAIYGGLGASAYYYITNDNSYTDYRTAYRRRKAGLPDDYDGTDGKPLISEAGLESAQRQTKKNREMSLLCGIVVYALQIVEASVTAHLLQFDDSDDLSVSPIAIPDPNFEELPAVGMAVKYTF